MALSFARWTCYEEDLQKMFDSLIYNVENREGAWASEKQFNFFRMHYSVGSEFFAKAIEIDYDEYDWMLEFQFETNKEGIKGYYIFIIENLHQRMKITNPIKDIHKVKRIKSVYVLFFNHENNQRKLIKKEKRWENKYVLEKIKEFKN